jgi:hypothetical protein
VALDDDLGHVIPVFLLHQHAQVDRQEAVQRIQAGLLDFRAVGVKEDVAFELDVAGFAVDGGGDVVAVEGGGQVADDARADADQGLYLLLLGSALALYYPLLTYIPISNVFMHRLVPMWLVDFLELFRQFFH